MPRIVQPDDWRAKLVSLGYLRAQSTDNQTISKTLFRECKERTRLLHWVSEKIVERYPFLQNHLNDRDYTTILITMIHIEDHQREGFVKGTLINTLQATIWNSIFYELGMRGSMLRHQALPCGFQPNLSSEEETKERDSLTQAKEEIQKINELVREVETFLALDDPDSSVIEFNEELFKPREEAIERLKSFSPQHPHANVQEDFSDRLTRETISSVNDEIKCLAECLTTLKNITSSASP